LLHVELSTEYTIENLLKALVPIASIC
jgi:hypothetical protein